MNIRKGVKEDLPQVLDLIQELANYEKAPDEVDNTLEKMEEDGFGDSPVFGLYVAEVEGKIVGISIYYYRYSTWKGKCLYLEDLVVKESYRGSGIGKKLFDVTVAVALETNCQLLNWQVLDWNEPAINFYKKLDTQFDGEWINCRLTREQLVNYPATWSEPVSF
ncbi:GNAT family N-acetyltransferase [Fulvivirgaceae bacterium BMA12]|uniref:GNAT family N-acetyltransferase n=1 Tax=Agaribacillus aureus TaxID=3051825 RepID=A0ABT8L4H6_9BACT|nr:GNAT family N-acetyltransferase [Fulvivirgaceae bacterium BMA12]